MDFGILNFFLIITSWLAEEEKEVDSICGLIKMKIKKRPAGVNKIMD